MSYWSRYAKQPETIVLEFYGERTINMTTDVVINGSLEFKMLLVQVYTVPISLDYVTYKSKSLLKD